MFEVGQRVYVRNKYPDWCGPGTVVHVYEVSTISLSGYLDVTVNLDRRPAGGLDGIFPSNELRPLLEGIIYE